MLFVYRVRQIQLRKNHILYPYCCAITEGVKALYNRANYIVRQYATGLEANENGRKLHSNQEEVLKLVRETTEGTKFAPKGKWLNYYQLDHILKVTKDPAYYGVPSHVNQQTLKLILRDYRSFFEGLKRYQREPKSFTGRPRLPRYKKTASTAILSNQICILQDNRFLKLPKCSLKADLGCVSGRLKEMRIKPMHDRIILEAVLEQDGAEEIPSNEEILFSCQEATHLERTLAIDPGVNNLLAITNNFGEQPVLVSGRILKSINQYYNKELARLRSTAALCNGKKTTKRIRVLTRKRNNRIKDSMHKISRWVKEYAVKNGARLVVMGHNKFQKQSSSMSRENNQTFVQLPMDMLIRQLQYKLAEAGILFVCTEESYTSQSDYLAQDAIPVCGSKSGEKSDFSGKRIRRGLYRHYDGTVSNADLNGAANIMRKVFPKVPRGLWDRGLLDSPYQAEISY